DGQPAHRHPLLIRALPREIPPARVRAGGFSDPAFVEEGDWVEIAAAAGETVSHKDWLARLGIWRLSVVLVILAGALAVLTPRLRAFYFGQGTERAGAALVRLPTQLVVGASTPGSTGAMPGRKPPLTEAEGRIRVRVSDRPPIRLPAEGVPAGWTVKEFVGHASVELVRDEARLALRLRSEHSSFAPYRDVVVDLGEFPFLSWSWKVVRLPPDGDVRERAADDSVAVFGRQPPRVGQVAVMIDTNDTRSNAEALIGDLVFGRTPVESMESPTSMLR